MKPERYNQYWATVHWHKPPGRQPSPQEGDRILVKTAWLMDEEDPFPGELAFLVDFPLDFPYWIPERDLVDFELAL